MIWYISFNVNQLSILKQKEFLKIFFKEYGIEFVKYLRHSVSILNLPFDLHYDINGTLTWSFVLNLSQRLWSKKGIRNGFYEIFSTLMYRKLSPSLPWEIISVPVVRPAYGTTGLLLMCPMGHQLKLIIYQGGILYEKVENYLLKSQDNFKNLFKWQPMAAHDGK